MSKQVINLGTAPSGVGGDTPRSANLKVISNFDELYAALGATGSPVALPSALPVANGGTGVTSMAAFLTALNALGNISRTNILGTVSQASGVPTGAIIERGGNSNGVYIKYADGTMTCFKVFSASVAVTSAYGSSFASAGQAGGAMPATFARVDNISIVAAGADGACTIGLAGASTTSAWPTFVVLNPVTGTKSLSIFLRADGVWFT